MGGPELPTDPGHEIFPTPAVDHPHIGTQSDDDDDESDAYDGYQPLAMDEAADPAIASGEPEVASAADNDEDIDLMTAPVTHGDPNMPPIESADVEIERQVWNEPRPKELQMELDKARTEQILKAMSTITLPNITIPDWAKGVPEERWKGELLDRINNRQQQSEDSSSADKPQHSKSHIV
ncbi:uncharacterized protein LOC110185863 [Drosophila serrata]|uniref:uncharacterized protein LOC110185863 n=1 Tax=Drosophila serrata TaxID=7274 RepID=UPI000A1D0FD1|nr:uncharacterized protein LOC110185863 [Drosophila serrata]KAH8393533.1 hypothetical protein KR200_004141 [Drosophila serrata]